MTLPFASTDTRPIATKDRTLWGQIYQLEPPQTPRLLGDRFGHLDMLQYRTSMPADGYLFFVTFAGAEMIGFSEGDFEDLNSADDL